METVFKRIAEEQITKKVKEIAENNYKRKERGKMRFSEFKKHIKSPWWRMNQGTLLVNPESLTVFTKGRNIRLVQDQRSFYDNIEGFWHIYPIATDRAHVYIVCPYCGEIHTHGSGGGNYEGHRVEHCKDPQIKETANGYYIEKAKSGRSKQ